MSQEASVSRLVLSEQVKDRLLQAILDGRFPPGARIVETRVARELGTSQAPVREALHDLEALGLVERSAFRGARVRRPSAEELLEAFVVRSQLESLAARLAVTTITDRDVDQMTEYLGGMRRAARADDARAEAMADAMFHGRLIELSRNATLLRVWRQLEPVSRTYITLAIPGADRHRIADVHQPVLDALRRRDAVSTTEALDRHYLVLGAMLTELWTAAPTTHASLQTERTP